MKIGILTLKLHNNYGGILQAYALTTILRQMGHEAFVLEEQCNNLKDKIKQITDIRNPLREFINNKIPIITTPKLSLEFIKDNNISCIIVGSDQVWRPRFTFIPNYYLNFLGNDSEIKRISYAASFGVSNWEYDEDLTNLCKNLISKFSVVSVREKSGIDLCREKLHSNAELVLDPTMLLNINEYIKNIKPKSSSKYIFSYLLDYSNKNNILVNTKISQHLGNIPIKTLKLYKNKFLKRINKVYSINEWISLIYNAEFVVTDSFHGCVFSILFNKNFIVLTNEIGGNSRIESLLEIFDLSERKVNQGDNINTEKLTSINWTKVNLLINKYKETSYSFLNSALQ